MRAGAAVVGALLCMGGTARATDGAPPAPPARQLVHPADAPPRTSIPEPVSSDLSSQYFFLHDENYFGLQVNGGSPPRVKFQISIRFEMISLGDAHNVALNFAYTQKSFWDMLDFAHSSPFVESDYHPELFVSYRPHRDVRYREAQLGCQHESNGLGAVGNIDQTPDSREWNACFAQGRWGFARDPGIEPWFFPAVSLRLWLPFGSDQPVVNAVGYGQLVFDLDLSIPNHLALGRFSNRLIVREHSVEDDLLYAILPVATAGRIRTWVFAQVFYGKAERLITAGDAVTHVYAGVAFQ